MKTLKLYTESLQFYQVLQFVLMHITTCIDIENTETEISQYN